jgi:hypothetical protein
MSTIQEVSAEQLAKLFHHYREALAHDCGAAHGTKEERSTWENASQSERKLMVAAARLTLLDLSTAIAQPEPGRKYYATPGEAEWGC